MFFGLAVWNKLPEQIPLHFDIHGNPSGWGEKWMLSIPVKEEKITAIKRTGGFAFVGAGLVGLAFSFTKIALWVFLSSVLVVVAITFYICAKLAE